MAAAGVDARLGNTLWRERCASVRATGEWRSYGGSVSVRGGGMRAGGVGGERWDEQLARAGAARAQARTSPRQSGARAECANGSGVSRCGATQTSWRQASTGAEAACFRRCGSSRAGEPVQALERQERRRHRESGTSVRAVARGSWRCGQVLGGRSRADPWA
jgi:hypothetical protein